MTIAPAARIVTKAIPFIPAIFGSLMIIIHVPVPSIDRRDYVHAR
jgi:hypothetical protein